MFVLFVVESLKGGILIKFWWILFELVQLKPTKNTNILKEIIKKWFDSLNSFCQGKKKMKTFIFNSLSLQDYQM